MSDQGPAADDRDERFSRYIRARTQTTMGYGELLAEEIARRLPQDQKQAESFGAEFLSDLSDRSNELEKLQWRLVVFGSLPIILLFLSLVGVKWELSALGVQLSDLQAIKEIVLLISACISAYMTVIAYRAFVIEKTIAVIGARLFGPQVFTLYKLRLPRPLNADMSELMNIRSERYVPTGAYLLTQLAWMLSLLMSFMLFIVLSILPSVYVMLDIWQAPNWPYLSRAAVVICGLVYVLCLVSSISVQVLRFSFYDRDKQAALQAELERDPQAVVKDAMKDETSS